MGKGAGAAAVGMRRARWGGDWPPLPPFFLGLRVRFAGDEGDFAFGGLLGALPSRSMPTNMEKLLRRVGDVCLMDSAAFITLVLPVPGVCTALGVGSSMREAAVVPARRGRSVWNRSQKIELPSGRPSFVSYDRYAKKRAENVPRTTSRHDIRCIYHNAQATTPEGLVGTAAGDPGRGRTPDQPN